MFNQKNTCCWVCFKDDSEAYCDKCGIGFHHSCIEEDFESTFESSSCSDEIIWIKECRECKNIAKSRCTFAAGEMSRRMRFEKMPESLLNSTLKKIFNNGVGIQPIDGLMKKWFKEEEYKRNISPLIDTINFKFIRNAYSCPEEFLFDVKKIRHKIRSEYPEVEAQLIDSYYQKVSDNCREMDLCPFCVFNYLSKPLGSIEPCPWGHKLVIVDRSQGLHFRHGSKEMERLSNLPPVFPAKILSYDYYKTKLVTVRYFGSLMSIKVPKNSVYHLRPIDLIQIRRSLSLSPDQKNRKETESALKMVNLHLAKLRGIYGRSIQLSDRKRNWSPNDGYFISRGVDKTKLGRSSKLSGRYSFEFDTDLSDHKEHQDESINSNVLVPDGSFDKEDNYLEASTTSKGSSNQENEVESMDFAPFSRPTTEIVRVPQDSTASDRNSKLGPQFTFSSSDERSEIEKSFDESEQINEGHLIDRKLNISFFRVPNQLNDKGDPLVIDLTSDEEEEESEISKR